MALVELAARLREETGKGAAYRIRHGGALPGIIYGQGSQNIAITVEQSDFDRLLRNAGGGAVVIDLKLDRGDELSLKALIKDMQRDPVSSRPTHIDLLRISMEKPVQLMVPVRLSGISEGVKTHGGFMDHVLRDVEIACLPDRIPSFIEIDVTAMMVGDSVHARDVSVEGVTLVTPGDRVIVAVHGKTAGPEETAAGQPAAAGEEKKES